MNSSKVNFAKTDRLEGDRAIEHPIPPPSKTRQYRAIGLIRGKYRRSEEKINRGTLVTEEGTAIEAVLLGRTLGLFKKRLDLHQSHLWIVYPRNRQDRDYLHLQIVGVWEPETLHPQNYSQRKPSDCSAERTGIPIQSGYFSVRGEVIYYLQETETVVVKIRQAAKKPASSNRFFKLKLKGVLPGRPLHHFWDLQARLEGNMLVILTAKDLGPASIRKKRQPTPRNRKYSDSSRPTRLNRNDLHKKTSTQKLPAPIKKVKSRPTKR